MSQLKDRLRDKLNVPVGEKVELYIWDGSGGVIKVGDDDSVEQVVLAIVQVHIVIASFFRNWAPGTLTGCA